MKTGDTVAWVIVDNHGNLYDEQYETRDLARADAEAMMKERRALAIKRKLKLHIARVVIEE